LHLHGPDARLLLNGELGVFKLRACLGGAPLPLRNLRSVQQVIFARLQPRLLPLLDLVSLHFEISEVEFLYFVRHRLFLLAGIVVLGSFDGRRFDGGFSFVEEPWRPVFRRGIWISSYGERFFVARKLHRCL
jgi:hypothetical protein